MITIRSAKVEDAHAIAEAEREIAQEPGFFCSQPSELTDENVADTISSFAKDKRGVYLIAEHEGRLAGHAFLKPYTLQSLSHIADLNIAVHLGWQGKGIGKQLLTSILEWARNSPALEKVQLNVRASNTKAIFLYKKFGFQEEGRLRNRVKIKKGYIDDIIMGLDLTNKASLLFREMHASDIGILAATFCLPRSTKQQTVEKWTKYFNEHGQHRRTVYLLEKQGQIIGYASLLHMPEYSYFKNDGIPEINDLWIQEDLRRRGYGKLLIRHLENMAREQGYKKIGLGVGLFKDYGSAQILYCKLGYLPDGNGITYKTAPAIPDQSYPIDDDLILWLVKPL